MSEILNVAPDRPDPQRVAYAAHRIRAGQVVAIPTDTLYGLAADPFNLSAVEQIFRIKSRPGRLALLVGSIDQAEDLGASLPARFYGVARRFWPGPLTIVVPAARVVPRKITLDGRVALRWPKNAVAQAVLDELQAPITGTSANFAGLEPCTTAADVQLQLGSRVSLILDGGDSGSRLPSTIIEIVDDSWKLIRPGVVPESAIRDLFDE